MRKQTTQVLRQFARAHNFSASAWRTLKRSYNKLPARSKMLLKQAVGDNDVVAVRKLLASVA